MGTISARAVSKFPWASFWKASPNLFVKSATGLKVVPFVGLVSGIGFGAYRFYKGEGWKIAMAEVTSGAVSIIPGYGTAASLTITAGIIGHDAGKAANLF